MVSLFEWVDNLTVIELTEYAAYPPSERNGECDETYQCEYFHRDIGLLPEVHPADHTTDNRDDPYGANSLGLIRCLEVTLGELVDVLGPADDAEEDEDAGNEW